MHLTHMDLPVRYDCMSLTAQVGTLSAERLQSVSECNILLNTILEIHGHREHSGVLIAVHAAHNEIKHLDYVMLH